MRARPIFALGVVLAGSLCATTLQQLSMDDMIRKSTAIVRAKVIGAHSAAQGDTVWTLYGLQIIETLKPSSRPFTEVALPGGVAGGVRQTVAGAPQLTVGQEYVVFVWVGRSGLPQVMGLSQGLFNVSRDASGKAVLTRPAAAERMVDTNGRPVDSQPVDMQLADLRSRLRQVAGARK